MVCGVGQRVGGGDEVLVCQDNTCLATAITSPVFMVDVQQVWTVWRGPGVTGVHKTQLVGRLPARSQPRSLVDVQWYGVGWRD